MHANYDHDFTLIRQFLNIYTLESARERAHLFFAFKMVKNAIDYSALVSKFDIFISRRTQGMITTYFL